MPASPSITLHHGRRLPHAATVPITEPESRFERRLGEILGHATDVFCEKGYEGASMRDLSRATGMSLAGLYHYFGSKERLLYLIQKHTFTTIIEKLESRLEGVANPEQRIRLFIQNHLEYFVANQSGLKVLSHEDEALKNEYGAELAALKRQYYRLCIGLMDELKRDRVIEFDSRTAVMSLFGMINWIYTWYNPRVDGTAEDLAQQMGDVFLNGVSGKIVARLARAEGRLAAHSQRKDKDRDRTKDREKDRNKDVKGHAVRRA